MIHVRVLQRIRRFRALEPGDRSLLIEAAILLGIVQVGLRTIPLRALRRVLTGVKRFRARSRPAGSRIAWAVNAAAPLVPPRSCLSDALAADVMLCRRGYPSTVWFGVKPLKGRTTALDAHAWVESDGSIVAGALDTLHEYRPFPQRNWS